MYSTFLTILIPSVLAFALTLFSTRFLMTYLYGAGIVAEDHNKSKIVRLAGSGGVAVAFGMIVGILVYIFGGSFVFIPVSCAVHFGGGAAVVSSSCIINQLLAVALSIVLIAFVGFLDDINVMRERVMSTDRMDIRKGLKQWQKPLLTLIGALPLMAINAGVHSVHVPFFGTIFLGLLYPLVVLPLAIIFVSNAFNLLGGFDGLQPSMAIIATAGLLIYSLLFGTYIGTLLSALLLATLLAFLMFNKYPAKIIPGDSFTYTVGASLVAIMVMGSAEAFGIIIFIPWIIEFLLHARRKFKVSDLGIRQKDGTFKAPYGRKIYSLTHLVMNIRPMDEKQVTLYLSILEAAFVIAALGLKVSGLL